MSSDIECAGCGDEIDTLTETHYRVGEEERPVKQLEKAEAELEASDFYSRAWSLCRDCIGAAIPELERGENA
ncbi:hypothetical protein ACFQGT_00130 [Natrialbaceae archaeon GCM10025810]